jgi:hypothetical protein
MGCNDANDTTSMDHWI